MCDDVMTLDAMARTRRRDRRSQPQGSIIFTGGYIATEAVYLIAQKRVTEQRRPWFVGISDLTYPARLSLF